MGEVVLRALSAFDGEDCSLVAVGRWCAHSKATSASDSACVWIDPELRAPQAILGTCGTKYGVGFPRDGGVCGLRAPTLLRADTILFLYVCCVWWDGGERRAECPGPSSAITHA